MLDAMYDDRFVVYVNGVEVLSVGFDGTVPYSTFSRRHEAGNQCETFDLSQVRHLLGSGTDVLRCTRTACRAAISSGTGRRGDCEETRSSRRSRTGATMPPSL